ncbi:MAG: hypothetical protein IKS93_06010 [Methanobrevibacter sp.]|nr:hypothetical protein [Methanobrevibacter sp.]
MNKITPQDIQEGVESVSASPESTWYKVVETLDNGDKLCLAIGMGEGFDEDTVCAKLGVLAGNSGMSDYVWDFVMPWNLGEGGNDVWDTEISNPGESDAEWFNTQAEEMIRGFEDGTIGTSLVNSRKNKRSVKSSHKPIKSMLIQDDISGEELYDLLWSGGLSNFKRMVEDGADPDQILNVCEMLLNDTCETVPTMTELSDLIWFDEETIRDYVGLTGPIESGCHGKRKKGKGKKKAVKSAMQISEIHNNTSNLYARIVYCDLESDVSEFNEEELIPINDFKEQCKGYAESTNGWFTVSHDNSYEPGEYIVTFTNQEGENNEFESDPYFENELGYVKFELVCDAGEELCNYLEDDRMM